MKQCHKMVCVVNPYSGNGRTARKWPELAAIIENQIGPFELLKTQRAGDATVLVRQALRDGYDRIVSVGGDGTHHEVLNGFFDGLLPINPRAAMAILPMGTASDLARTLHIPKGKKAIPHLVSDRVVAADLGRVSFTLPNGGQQFLYFINTCHIGMGGAVGRYVNNSSKQYGGLFTYLWGSLRTLFRYHRPLERASPDYPRRRTARPTTRGHRDDAQIPSHRDRLSRPHHRRTRGARTHRRQIQD